MSVDYYALLSKAVTGKDAAAREAMYRDAHGLIRRSHLSREDVASHSAALDNAIRRIEAEFATEDARSAEEISEVLATPDRNWKPLVVGVSALVAAVALAALTYGYIVSQTPRAVTADVKTPPQKVAGAREDVVVADLKPGVDGGSTGKDLPFAFQRQVVFYRTTVVPGSIVIDRENRYLYLIDVNNSARRYGIGIAQECQKGGSFFRVANKMEWPDWKAAGASAKEADALVPTGSPGSPLGARALLLDKPGLLIHGTNSPKTIGHLVASGCIRLVNEDVEDLYRRVSVDTRVVFVS
ncbi:MAG: L,D-transpeptidase [Bradyrhizobium sp.]|nr:L,D-transpeptidase [Bradyrhizobium sp.]